MSQSMLQQCLTYFLFGHRSATRQKHNCVCEVHHTNLEAATNRQLLGLIVGIRATVPSISLCVLLP